MSCTTRCSHRLSSSKCSKSSTSCSTANVRTAPSLRRRTHGSQWSKYDRRCHINGHSCSSNNSSSSTMRTRIQSQSKRRVMAWTFTTLRRHTQSRWWSSLPVSFQSSRFCPLDRIDVSLIRDSQNYTIGTAHITGYAFEYCKLQIHPLRANNTDM